MCGRYVLSDTINVKRKHNFDVSASYYEKESQFSLNNLDVS